ncbi:MAG TPA: RNA polymerase sigma-70 factor [Ktedonobacterales bacterium]|nr:RNA polymerase sigma-70 factor [Ktedonobacterales bacterium]
MKDEPVPPVATNEIYEGLRPLMFSIAYRILGSVSEAEDVVQEAFLRFHRTVAQGKEIESPKAFLATATTRLAIDAVRSARAKHEAYVGVWLPEPLAISLEPDPAEHAEMSDSLSLAFLVLLQTLSPVERAVFVLREVFDYDYDEIAKIVQKSEDNCRQIFARAKKRIDAGKPRFDVNPEEQRELANRFFDAAGRGDMTHLVEFLAADAAFYGDGGGKAHAYPRPVVGRRLVALIFKSLFKSARDLGATIQFALVNGQPGAVSFDTEGRVISVLALVIADGAIQAVHSIVNPDKLTHLGFPVSDRARINRGDA